MYFYWLSRKFKSLTCYVTKFNILASILGVQSGLSMGKSYCMLATVFVEEIAMCIKELIWPSQKQKTES